MDELKHYGTPRHSGRYPWGSGDTPYQRSVALIKYIDEAKRKGRSDLDIARDLGMSTTEYRQRRSIARTDIRQEQSLKALKLKDKGYSNVEIGKQMGLNESSVRALLDPHLRQRAEVTRATADVLKHVVAEKGLIDVGVGVENHMGVTRTKLKTSIALLKEEGYTVHYIPVEQVGTGKNTTVTVLAPPGTTFADVYKNRDNIGLIGHYTEDGGKTYLGIEEPRSVSSKRVGVRYSEDGGSLKDGVIEIRPGKEDLSLGNAKYAQVRIAVDGTHYLKGMAIYSDDLPDGVDIMFNTNKSKATTSKMEALKKMKDDEDNPFGAVVKQRKYIDKDGKEQLSSLNIVNEEGDWGNWSKTISSQVLSKQSRDLAKKQLGLALAQKQDELKEIMSLTNPAVKKKLLESFADDADASAVHLKAAALPRQQSHVILPYPGMKENEVYAPNYRNGEKVVLIRHPHGGIFEIPELTVNNKYGPAKKSLGNAKDGIGINPKVAEKLSGADFDGDTVIVIPNNNRSIKTMGSLTALKNFDPKELYPLPKTAPKMTAKQKGKQMGDISNLITDMTIKGADYNEISRAVRHSMVVIDAEKHHLDYKKSAQENGIAALKTKYQGGANKGASTLISKASSVTRVGERKEKINTSKMTPTELAAYKRGEKVYEYSGATYVDKKGKTQLKTEKSTKMAEAKNAKELSSGTPMEEIYASYANKLKAMANTSRKEIISTKNTPYSPSAKKTYSKEVESLNAKLNEALRNKPLERQAQILANSIVKAKREANPDMEFDALKKIKGQALDESRRRVGAKKNKVDITDQEWDAIQAGAVTTNILTQILTNANEDRVKQLATPKTATNISATKVSKARAMIASGYTRSEVADSLGVSISTLSKSLD